MPDVNKVLIVGGGVGGVSLAIRLQGMGIAPDLVEIDPAWRALGAGLTLNGATLRAFDKVGVLDRITAEGHVHGGRRTHDVAGNVIVETPAYTPEPGDINAGGGILRPVLHAILTEKAIGQGLKARLGMTVDRLDQTPDGVEVGFSDGSTGVYDLVVGADGLRSRVRSLAFPDAPQPRFTGQGCWRAVFPRPDYVQAGWGFIDDTHKLGFNPVSQDEMYMFLLETVPHNPWREPDTWPDLLSELLEPYGGLVAEMRQRLGPDSRINYRPLESLLLPPPWHQGRIVLLGDACHATTPHAGYGAGLSVEDAVVLSEVLASTLPLEAALTAYVERRYERCRGVLQGSLRVGELEMAARPIAEQRAAAAELSAFVRQVV